MRRRIFVLLIAVGLLLAFGVGAAGAVPNDGDGNKFVVAIDDGPIPIPCNGGFIELNADGWVQGREYGPENNRNIALTVFHIVLTYTNNGETWTYTDVGPDHLYLVGEELHVSLTGRPQFIPELGGGALFGHIVINLNTGRIVLTAGNEFGVVGEVACDALT